VTLYYGNDRTPLVSTSFLPAAAKAVNFFVSSSQHLVHLALDVTIRHICTPAELALVDFSPLEVLGAASLSIPQIDLYVHTDILQPDLTHATLLSSLEVYEDVVRSTKDGVLVVHPEETAPDCVSVYRDLAFPLEVIYFPA
jgi:hypothetical protein